MRNPRKLLPRALYTSVILVMAIYLAVSITVSGNLSDYEIERARDYALAEAAKPSLGQFGFRLIAIAALFSTASAITATLFGSANVCYMIARDGELPVGLSRTEWKDATGGLLLTAALVIAVMLVFDLSGITMMGSAAFLLIYAAVNAGHLNVLRETEASAAIVWLSLLTCLAMLVVLCVYTCSPPRSSSSPRSRSRRNGFTGAGPAVRSRRNFSSILPPTALVPAPGTQENRRCEAMGLVVLCRAIFVGTRKAGTQIRNSEPAALDSRIARRRRA